VDDAGSVVEEAVGPTTPKRDTAERTTRRRNLAIAAAALVLACICTQWPFVVDDPYEAWDTVMVAADGRSAVVSYEQGGGDDLDDPCAAVTHVVATPRADVMELEVRIFDKRRLFDLHAPVACNMMAWTTAEEVRFPEPLNGRRIVDPQAGRARRAGAVVHLGDALHYTAPAGLGEEDPYVNDYVSPPLLVRTFTRGEFRFTVSEPVPAAAERTSTTTTLVDDLGVVPRPATAPVAVGTVAGTVAVDPGWISVEWPHGDRRVSVQGFRGSDGAPPSRDEVLALAEHVEKGG
jgi:hypothetical protein